MFTLAVRLSYLFLNRFLFLCHFLFLAGALGGPGGGERGAGPADPPPGPGEPRPPADEDVSEPGGGDVQVRCTISGGFSRINTPKIKVIKSSLPSSVQIDRKSGKVS